MRILRSIATNIYKSSQALDHCKACSTVSGQPWNQLDAMVKTRWWSLFTFLDSFMFNIKTLRYMRDCPKHPNVPPELYNLTDLLIGDLECARVVAQGIMKAQLNIEGQKYLTSSMAIPIIEELRESLRSTRMHYTTIDAPRGVKILEDIIEGFDKRFGDGTHITEFREDHGHQPCGYTRCVACDLFLVHLFVMVTLDCVYL
jgi:hypothetical protein